MGAQSMEQDAPQIGVVVGGKFRVTRVLGKGGMGVVVAARNLVTGKQVAIKWMHAAAAAHHDAVHRLIQEAAASARVRHPNVVDVYDVIHDENGVFLVMEYLNGEPLTRMLERGGMPVSELIAVLIGAMRGVAAAHKAGVIHRDIKPDNIFLIRGADSQPCITKVLDFGISKITDNRGPSLTQTGTALGTPMYMSCEQLRNARDVDGRADIYAFGVILYEAVTGQSPFPGDGFAEVVAKIMTTEPATPKSLSENLPDRLDEVIRQAMAKNRDDRISTMDNLIRELEPFATEPKFQLNIPEEEDDLSVPVDPSMVTALTPAARSVIAHANTIGQPGAYGGPTPSSPFRTAQGRRDHSGMVPLDLTPRPGTPLPGWNSALIDDDSIRPAHRTLDPRVTAGLDRQRHVGVIGLLVAGATLVGLVALFWPAMDETGSADDTLAPPVAALPAQQNTASAPIETGAPTVKTTANAPQPQLSPAGEVAAGGQGERGAEAAQRTAAAKGLRDGLVDGVGNRTRDGMQPGVRDPQDGANDGLDAMDPRGNRRGVRNRRDRRELTPVADMGERPVGGVDGPFREPPPAPPAPTADGYDGEDSDAMEQDGDNPDDMAYGDDLREAPSERDPEEVDPTPTAPNPTHDDRSDRWRAGELRRDEF